LIVGSNLHQHSVQSGFTNLPAGAETADVSNMQCLCSLPVCATDQEESRGMGCQLAAASLTQHAGHFLFYC